MNFSQLVRHGQKALRANSPSILTAIGVSGTITTAYLAGKASWEAQQSLYEQCGPDAVYLSLKDKLEFVWHFYIPPVVSGVVTVGCILGANHVSSKRAAAAYSLVSLSERTFEEYRNKVIEQHGERKDKAIRDEVAQDRINANPPSQAIIAGTGEVLCCEMHTDRYFKSDMETLRRAQNDVNAKLLREMYVTLNEFYYLVGSPNLDQTSHGSVLGWTSDRLMELEFYPSMSPQSVPCIAFDYSYTKTL